MIACKKIYRVLEGSKTVEYSEIRTSTFVPDGNRTWILVLTKCIRKKILMIRTNQVGRDLSPICKKEEEEISNKSTVLCMCASFFFRSSSMIQLLFTSISTYLLLGMCSCVMRQ